MSEVTYKVLKEIFKDYNSSNLELMNSKIKIIELNKKTNALKIILLVEKNIKIKDLESLERYLETRFLINSVRIIIEKNDCNEDTQDNSCEFTEDIKIDNVHEKTELSKIENTIQNEWNDIIEYISVKHPMEKAILANSEISIDNKMANITLAQKGKDFLFAQRLDENLSQFLQDIYGKKYKVSIVENYTEDAIEKYQEYAKKMQEQAIKKLEEREQIKAEASYMAEKANLSAVKPTHENSNAQGISNGTSNVLNSSNTQNTSSDSKSVNTQNNEISQDNIDIQVNMSPIGMPPIDDAYFDVPTEDDYLKEIEELEAYILGKPSKAKEKLVKIKDITADNAKITIEGRVSSCECRETKTGKGMIIYEIYDGTGIITCKSFAKDINEGNEIATKIKESTGIKTIGKASLDTFLGDVSIMANTIVKIDGENLPKLPTEDENSPLIYGTNPEIKENLVKVRDISVDTGMVCIDGEIISMEEKELKGGKILLTVAVYDGTSTISCKVFLTKDNIKKVTGRLKGCKGIKVARKSFNGYICK